MAKMVEYSKQEHDVESHNLFRAYVHNVNVHILYVRLQRLSGEFKTGLRAPPLTFQQNESVASTRAAPRLSASNEKRPSQAPISSTVFPLKSSGILLNSILAWPSMSCPGVMIPLPKSILWNHGNAETSFRSNSMSIAQSPWVGFAARRDGIRFTRAFSGVSKTFYLSPIINGIQHGG